ncbi:MAG: phosphatidate cytidylyltransferase, partial [Pseudomonadota bacterium]|nr:phosphatidate cytidylyltransferase [Pseudomonadota bacterium]
VLAQVGDLSVSAVKRRYGVKDASGLIPGHGGVLDRLDSLLLSAPTVAIVLLVTGRGWI